MSFRISPAARFSKPGDEVQLLVKAVGNAIRFSVVDHGPGIAKEFQSRIFDRFFRIPVSVGLIVYLLLTILRPEKF